MASSDTEVSHAAKRARPHVLVAVSGWGKEEDRQRSREAGFDLHLVKPVEPDEILDQVRKAAARP